MAEGRSVTPQYFRAMNIPLLAGRFFTEDDVSSAARPTIVNQQFAKVYFANRNPIGGRISTDEKDHSHWSTVVGVVADVRHFTLEEAPQPQMYVPGYEFGGAYIAVRSVLPPSTVASEIRGVIKGHRSQSAACRCSHHGRPDVRSKRPATLSNIVAHACLPPLLFLLALVGLYGLMAYSVSCRTRELGIRMALGAQRTHVTLLVLRKAGVAVGIGPGLGPCMLVDRDARHQSVPLWRWRTRSSHHFVGLRVACGLRPDRCADPGATRRLDRSHAGAADGVGERKPPKSAGRSCMCGFLL